MIEARITDGSPVLTAYIYSNTPIIQGVIQNSPSIKGVIEADAPFVIGQILKSVSHEADPYYEVSNESGGFTIIIGD